MESQTAYFTAMAVIILKSQNISTQASARTSTWVLVHEYKCEHYYFGTHEHE